MSIAGAQADRVRPGAGALTVMIVLSILCGPALSGCRAKMPPHPRIGDFTGYLVQPPTLRVVLVKSAPRVRVSASGGYWVALGGRPAVRRVQSGIDLLGMAEPTERGIRVGDRTFRTSRLTLGPGPRGRVFVQGRPYRGVVVLARLDRNRLSATNLVDVEDYLAGVLGEEMPLRWPAEALKAQAIAARTFALYRKKARRTSSFDLAATTLDQVYAGVEGESERAWEIVNATRGVVMVFEWRLFPAFFHSTCGGHTEDARRSFGRGVFPGSDRNFMSGVPCETCRGSPHYGWTCKLSAAEVSRKVGLKEVREIRPLGCGPSGRATKVRISHAGGNKVFSLREFRGRVGRGLSRLRSGAFEVEPRGGAGFQPVRFVFRGRGFGHGVGMCQYGALGMARQGASYGRILAHYYRGAKLIRIY